MERTHHRLPIMPSGDLSTLPSSPGPYSYTYTQSLLRLRPSPPRSFSTSRKTPSGALVLAPHITPPDVLGPTRIAHYCLSVLRSAPLAHPSLTPPPSPLHFHPTQDLSLLVNRSGLPPGSTLNASALNFTALGIVGLCGSTAGCGTSQDVGLQNSAFYGGQILGNLVMSSLSDRIGRKPIIITSLIASTIGYMWCGLAPNLTHLYLGRAFSGIAGGTMPVLQGKVLEIT